MALEAVEKELGSVTGLQLGAVAEFRSAPFAHPSIRQLRFASPDSPRSWEGTSNATQLGPIPRVNDLHD
jgi:para-nitrobenzyl esterase